MPYVYSYSVPLFEGRRRKAAKFVEPIETRYEVQNVEVGKVYSWCPKSVLTECGCGETLTVNVHRTTCGKRAAEHTAITEGLFDQIARVSWPLRAHTRRLLGALRGLVREIRATPIRGGTL